MSFGSFLPFTEWFNSSDGDLYKYVFDLVATMTVISDLKMRSNHGLYLLEGSEKVETTGY